jgi:hypothetical protein
MKCKKRFKAKIQAQVAIGQRRAKKVTKELGKLFENKVFKT